MGNGVLQIGHVYSIFTTKRRSLREEKLSMKLKERDFSLGLLVDHEALFQFGNKRFVSNWISLLLTGDLVGILKKGKAT